MSERDDFRLIGDPHITRKFTFGVPLARRGERERMLFDDFKSRLYQGAEKTVIVVGDLFEKPICSLADLHETMRTILTAAARQPQRQFLIMAGNHDISSQKSDPGAFDILVMLNGFFSNLHFVLKPMVYDGIALFPWEWDRSAYQQLEDVQDKDFDIAVGHWDLVAYDDMHMNHFCPAASLVKMGAKKIYSGHWHVAGDYTVDGHTVHCTGSMQPMTHSEDPSDKMYVTLTLEQFEATDPATLKNKYVRVEAEPDDIVEPLTDCLGFKVKRGASNDEEHYDPVEVDSFSAKEIMENNLKKHEVSKAVSQYIKDRIDADD